MVVIQRERRGCCYLPTIGICAREMTKKRALGFNLADLDAFFARMKTAVPPVHHSETYQQTYQSAYQVVLRELIRQITPY
jgi:hypothetical protein